MKKNKKSGSKQLNKQWGGDAKGELSNNKTEEKVEN